MEAETALALLKDYLAWGADEAIADVPTDRLRAPPPTVVAASPAPALQPPRAAGMVLARPPAVTRAEQAAAAARDIDGLRAALAGFDGCALRNTATSLVFEDGSPDATIMLVGDVPGADEDRSGVPFAGPVGQYLDRMLASIGLDRGQVLLTTLIPWRPPGNRPPTDAEVAICLPFLQRHIILRAPRLLVLLGALPARALLGRAERRRTRAALRDVEIGGHPVVVMAITHPAAAMAAPSARRDAWADLRLLRRTIDGQMRKN